MAPKGLTTASNPTNSTGWLQQQPLYWVNFLPAATFVAFTAATVPSRERLERIFVDKILGRGY